MLATPQSGAVQLELLARTNSRGEIGAGPGYPYGPYFDRIPLNHVTNSANIKLIDGPPTVGDTNATDGWLYNAATSDVWMNNSAYLH